MEFDGFVEGCLCLDLETGPNGEIISLGAILGDNACFGKGGSHLRASLDALTGMARGAKYLLGHNLIHHDLQFLAAAVPRSPLLQLPVVDTLYLSPLAFPENPYHRLVKDYKLVRDAMNDPLADARTALSVFNDQWESFTAMDAKENGLLSFFLYAFSGDPVFTGMQRVFRAMGASHVDGVKAFDLFRRIAGENVCAEAPGRILAICLNEPSKRVAPAFALSWLRVAGGNSVIPPWVAHRFPDVASILRDLRDIPCGRPECGYCSEAHDPGRLLERFFGFSEFRPQPAGADGESLQETVVTRAMGDQPVLAVLPTGAGKSLCYQLPALARHFRRSVLTIVISPLQALMKDQVDHLRSRAGAPAAALNGLLTPPERGEVLEGVRMGDVGVLYVSPEQLRNRSFRDAVRNREIGCWVFDEAHCLSKWGHDFRPDYIYAARFIKEFSIAHQGFLPPVQCFSATAKEDVKAEILDHFRTMLGVELEVFSSGVERENLHFEVQTVSGSEKHPRLHSLLSERLLPDLPGCCIVYCATRKGAEAAAEYLLAKGWQAQAFHAGIDASLKREIQDGFMEGRNRVICATNAFGMGIDKEDVRLVVHLDIPGSLENYIQEAGRAGRDRLDAECVLFYDEEDIETQFRLSAFSRLERRDIAGVLRVLRKARRDKEGNVVLTAGELVRDEAMEDSIDPDDSSAGTKVVTAISWLERGGFLERNENRTQVFQGRPMVRSLKEASDRIERLGLSARRKAQWLAILEALINADPDKGFSADELAEMGVFRREPVAGGPTGDGETEAQRVLRTLYDMAEAGLIRKTLLMSAFVRYKVVGHSGVLLEQACRLEAAMLDALGEEAPDADSGEIQTLSLRRLNQRLLDQGFDRSNPETIRNLLSSLAQDGKGLAGSRGSIVFRYAGRDRYRVKLQRDWASLRATAELRRTAARVVLNAILGRIPAGTPPDSNVLVEFSAEDLLLSLKGDLILAASLKDPLAAVDRALLFLHEQRVITLQKGLAVFRQAMTIRVFPEAKGRRYTKGDYEPLSRHYGERVFQIHVINEYARKGAEKIGQAIALVMAYFSTDKAEFVKRYFPGRAEILERATSGEAFRRIVDDLGNPRQAAVVAAPEEDNMLILAGPGSGKTRVVVHRCAYLLRVARVRPEGILILCFNRSAVTELRRRLRNLVGRDAIGVTVQTYHGLALRLSGKSMWGGNARIGLKEEDFSDLIREATALLEGGTDPLGVEKDELRDRLLRGYRHILVDEYQDIDKDQYDLISAIAGRSLKEDESRLGILAVGDDDQNIYQFRGANVEFIRRFKEDYAAQTHYLVENYRSSRHIIEAANNLIAQNRDRMKKGSPIRIDDRRGDLPPGGTWDSLDPVAKGRVQIIRCAGEAEQARAALDELMRLKELDSRSDPEGFAVLAREWRLLQPLRHLMEENGLQFSMSFPADRTPPLLRVRENARFLEDLKARGREAMSATQMLGRLGALFPVESGNIWMLQLRDVLEAWRDETGDDALPAREAVEYLYEALAEKRRERRFGRGVFLGTAHSVKGMEFKHVFILNGGWDRSLKGPHDEEERRLFYVAMTRARETLCLMHREDANCPWLKGLKGDFVMERRAVSLNDRGFDSKATLSDYEMLGLQDSHLNYAGFFPSHHLIHKTLESLNPGVTLEMITQGRSILLARGETPVARLSASACERWRDRLPEIHSIRVTAMVKRFRDDGEAGYRKDCRVDEWEIPVVEVRLNRHKAGL